MVVFVAIAVCIVLFWLGYALVGFPLVITEKIQDYRKGLMDSKERRLWKVALILFAINLPILVFILLGLSKS